MMKNDTDVLIDGMEILTHGLNVVDAERFIHLIIREQFNYTNWQESLFDDMSVRDLSNNAMKYATKR